ncbi:RHS repeat-associated core domain-containing protein [Vibrio rhizosphaerae]|uniref:RHS repeat-associated core domain-containing protein n=1 Tax=Vibrio rhizosphaerae TaxID=398736 RepID=A0ABU4ITM7_9VIBR|nr:RHS repeat-associated core domain-containing protein [Vibrio rhizosphaerae]MDW6091669.1 RHS repeat-associated core domain-containing protein [Vibrio rhizosphaerae]
MTDTKTGEVQHKHFIYADGKLIALNTQVKDADDKLKDKQIRYLHYDALESVDMITDGYGVVVERRSYDTWGKQRKVSWREDGPLDVVQAAITNRGYTGHEEITEVGLIHMNGRAYDQELGRFISPDPEIQAPFVTNSFNRYSYVWNNPLKYQDPTGYSVEGLGGQCSPDSSGDGGSGDHGGNNGCDTSDKGKGTGNRNGHQGEDDSSSDTKKDETEARVIGDDEFADFSGGKFVPDPVQPEGVAGTYGKYQTVTQDDTVAQDLKTDLEKDMANPDLAPEMTDATFNTLNAVTAKAPIAGALVQGAEVLTKYSEQVKVKSIKKVGVTYSVNEQKAVQFSDGFVHLSGSITKTEMKVKHYKTVDIETKKMNIRDYNSFKSGDINQQGIGNQLRVSW